MFAVANTQRDEWMIGLVGLSEKWQPLMQHDMLSDICCLSRKLLAAYWDLCFPDVCAQFDMDEGMKE